MREILFKGKKIDNNEWVYGSYINTCNECEISDINCIVGSKHDVHKETVGQYTGLKDKNGVKIFEGDITKYGVVVFENGCFGVLGENDFVCFDLWNIDILEIIGNIHDK